MLIQDDKSHFVRKLKPNEIWTYCHLKNSSQFPMPTDSTWEGHMRLGMSGNPDLLTVETADWNYRLPHKAVVIKQTFNLLLNYRTKQKCPFTNMHKSRRQSDSALMAAIFKLTEKPNRWKNLPLLCWDITVCKLAVGRGNIYHRQHWVELTTGCQASY